MCKEDIRLARAARSGATFTAAAPATAVQVLPGDANRYAISAGIGVLTPVTLQVSCMIAALVGGQYVPLIGLSADHPAGHVSLTDVGSILQEPIWFLPAGSDPPTNLYVGCSAFDQPLESI